MLIAGFSRCHLRLKSPVPDWIDSSSKARGSLVTDLPPRLALSSCIPLQPWHGVCTHIGRLASQRELMRTRGSRGGRRDRRRKRPRDVERESGRPPRRVRQGYGFCRCQWRQRWARIV